MATARAVLKSAKGAPVILTFDGLAGGALWMRSILAALGYPRGKPYLAILDCGDQAGAVMEGLAEGLTDFLYNGPRAAARKLASMAQQQDGRLYVSSREGKIRPLL